MRNQENIDYAIADSLLVSLSTYRSRPERTPIEDFITEAFAWLLRSQDGLGRAFLQWVENEGPGRRVEAEEIKWSTQVSFPASRPDMVAWAGPVTYAFEHKVHAEASSDQLHRHQEGVREASGELGRTILITSASWHHAEPVDVALTWPDIHRWLSDVNVETDDSPMVREFQALLESRGLGPHTEISETSFRAYAAVQKAEQQIWALMQGLLDNIDGG